MSSSNSGGPWGGGNNGGGTPPRPGNEGRRPPPPTDFDQIVKRGQDQLRVLMGGNNGSGDNGSGDGGGIGRSGWSALGFVVLLIWVFASFYRVDTSEQSIELLFGKYHQTGTDGLNFAPWPVVTYEKYPVTTENTVKLGAGSSSRADQGLMLTGDENIVDIGFQVVWNIKDLRQFVFNIAVPSNTVEVVSQSVVREIIARSQLAPILNKDRGVIAQELEDLIQATLDSYESGINIVRVNFDGADPPPQVIDAVRDVQAAEQERDTSEKQADAYSNRVIAEARGTAAQVLEEAAAYRAFVVNEAKGEASRFLAVYEEFAKAPEVTRKRLYIETLEKVLGDVDKVIIDQADDGGTGVVPYLPLNELNKRSGGDR